MKDAHVYPSVEDEQLILNLGSHGVQIPSFMASHEATTTSAVRQNTKRRVLPACPVDPAMSRCSTCVLHGHSDNGTSVLPRDISTFS